MSYSPKHYEENKRSVFLSLKDYILDSAKAQKYLPSKTYNRRMVGIISSKITKKNM